MPDGTVGKPYIAYSGVGSFFSVYHNVRCAYPTTGRFGIKHNNGVVPLVDPHIVKTGVLCSYARGSSQYRTGTLF